MNNKNRFLSNHTEYTVSHGSGHYSQWQDSVAHFDIGTIVAVKTLGQAISNEDLKTALEEKTFVSPEEIPLYAVDVLGSNGCRYNNCQILYPYVHSDPGLGGAGMYFIPEEGSQVALISSLTGQPIVLGFLSSVDKEETGFRNEKEALSKGSYCLKTSSGNKIILRKGGINLIQSTPACLRRYIPTRDQIRDLCQNYFMTTEGGGIEWVKDPQTGLYTNWKHTWFDHPKVLTDVESNVVQLDVGQDHDPNKQGRSIYNLSVKDVSGVEQFNLLVRPNGYLSIRSKDVRAPGDVEEGDEAGTIDLDADKDLDLTAGVNVRIGTTPSRLNPVTYPERAGKGAAGAKFDGSVQQTTDYINLQCEKDLYTTAGENESHIVRENRDIHVEKKESHVIDKDRNINVKGKSTYAVTGSFTQTASKIRLNPSAFGIMSSILGSLSAFTGGVTLSSLAPGAFNFTNSITMIKDAAESLETIATGGVQGLIDGALSLNIPYIGDFTNTVNSAIGDIVGGFPVIGEITSFSLENPIKGVLNMVEGLDFVQSVSSAIDLLPSANVLSFIDDGFGSEIISDIRAITGEFDVLQGIGLSGAIDGTLGIPDFIGDTLTEATGELVTNLTSGLFHNAIGDLRLLQLPTVGDLALKLHLTGPNNFPYTDPTTGDPVDDTIYDSTNGFTVI